MSITANQVSTHPYSSQIMTHRQIKIDNQWSVVNLDRENITLTKPNGQKIKFDSMKDLFYYILGNKEQNMNKQNENKEENTWYGVEPDSWHSDGSPVFQVDYDDYHSAIDRKPNTIWDFNDDRINTAIRKSGYKKVSCWLQLKGDDKDHRYKFVRPDQGKKHNNQE